MVAAAWALAAREHELQRTGSKWPASLSRLRIVTQLGALPVVSPDRKSPELIRFGITDWSSDRDKIWTRLLMGLRIGTEWRDRR